MGYGGDISKGERPLYHPASTIESVKSYTIRSDGTKSKLMIHSIDATNGQSGGPVFAFWDDKDGESMPYIVGVHVSDAGGACGGAGLSKLIRQLLKKYK